MRHAPVALLREIIAHDAQSGKMWWKPRPTAMFPNGKRAPAGLAASFNTRFAGTPALDCLDKTTGYLCGNIFAKRYQAHRVLWALEHGEWPEADIDHINGIRHDNRMENLRAASRSENMRNVRLRDQNTSGVTGVYWGADRNKWRAEIQHGGRGIKLGSFDTLEEAATARYLANIKFGYHPNHGKR